MGEGDIYTLGHVSLLAVQLCKKAEHTIEARREKFWSHGRAWTQVQNLQATYHTPLPHLSAPSTQEKPHGGRWTTPCCGAPR